MAEACTASPMISKDIPGNPIPSRARRAQPWQPNNNHQMQRFDQTHLLNNPGIMQQSSAFPKPRQASFCRCQRATCTKHNEEPRAFTLTAPSSTNLCGLLTPKNPSPQSRKVTRLYNGKPTGAGQGSLSPERLSRRGSLTEGESTDDFFISSANKELGVRCGATAEPQGLGFKAVATAVL